MTGILPPPPGCVDDVLRDCVTGCVSAQTFHDLDAFGNRCAEVTGTFDQVTLIEVIRSHADADQVLHKFALDMNIVIYTSQQNGLIAERDACSGETVAGLFQFQRNFIRVVHMDVDPQRVILSEHITKFLRNAHRQENRNA